MTTKIPLLKKYNVPAPRYTSYPTVPYWEFENTIAGEYLDTVAHSFRESNEQEGISIYIHLPFCESLCTFCGCNKRITKNHGVEDPYIETLIREWELYQNYFDGPPLIKEIHLGGGTPTFFSPENIQKLTSAIMRGSVSNSSAEMGYEAHPNATKNEHIELLFQSGYKRLSLGIQDNDPVVQKAINRIQPFERVVEICDLARKTGYTSINFDLVYGLPFQKLSSIKKTIEDTLEVMPDRIAFYSYAHVPWIKGLGQRKFTEKDLPSEDYKRNLYETGRQMLEDAGYREIGMDHFALETDSLYKSWQTGSLHRNFMGYTSHKNQLMIGLGVSAIGDSWYGFGQNVKVVEQYMEQVNSGVLPIFRGHILHDEDLYIRKKILDLMCFGSTRLDGEWKEVNDIILRNLQPLVEDHIVDIQENSVKILKNAFLRNACMAFDMRLWRKEPESQMFSMSV